MAVRNNTHIVFKFIFVQLIEFNKHLTLHPTVRWLNSPPDVTHCIYTIYLYCQCFMTFTVSLLMLITKVSNIYQVQMVTKVRGDGKSEKISLFLHSISHSFITLVRIKTQSHVFMFSISYLYLFIFHFIEGQNYYYKMICSFWTPDEFNFNIQDEMIF